MLDQIRCRLRSRLEPCRIDLSLTDDVVFHAVPGVEGIPPVVEGREAVLQQFKAMMQLGGQTIEHHNAAALAGYVVGLGTATFDVAGEQRRVQIVDVCRLRDGKLAERWALLDRPDELQRILDGLTATSKA